LKLSGELRIEFFMARDVNDKDVVPKMAQNIEPGFESFMVQKV
jgi:hypothetical protein